MIVKRETQVVRAVEPRTGSEKWNFSVSTHHLTFQTLFTRFYFNSIHTCLLSRFIIGVLAMTFGTEPKLEGKTIVTTAISTVPTTLLGVCEVIANHVAHQ